VELFVGPLEQVRLKNINHAAVLISNSMVAGGEGKNCWMG